MRLFWYSALLLPSFNLSCHRVSAPLLTHVEPSEVELSELPREVTLVGTNLNRTASLSLDDDNPARRELPQILLDKQPVKIVKQTSSKALTFLLPETMPPGEYDVSVTIRGERLQLRAGLTILPESHQLPDAAFALEASVEADGASSLIPLEAGLSTPPADSGDTTSGSPTSVADASHTSANASRTLDASSQELDASSMPQTHARDASDGDITASEWDAATTNTSHTTSWTAAWDTNTGTSEPSTISDDASLTWDANSADANGADANSSDASSDGSVVGDAGDPIFRCTPGEFGSPEVVTVGGYTQARLWSPTFTADGLTMYFTDGSNSSGKLMKATRSDRSSAFVDAVVLPRFFATGATGTPYVTPSGLSLYFYSIQTSGMGSRDLYVATRSSVNADFTGPTSVTNLNSTSLDHLPWVSPDERSAVWVSQRDGQASYWTATRPEKDDAFSSPSKLTSLSLAGNDGRMFITYDGLRAYFVSRDRAGGEGSDDVWYATRENTVDDFDGITNLGIVNTPDSETDVTLSHDGEELFFVRTGDENTLYRAVANCN